MNFVLRVFSTVCINMTGMLSLYVITGMGGMFSMGQASFMAIGAYAAGMVATSLHLPMAVGVVVGVAVGGLFAFVVGLPAVRLRRDFVALITFAFGEAIVALLNNFVSVFGGAQGLSGVPGKTTPLIAFLGLAFSIYVIYSFQKSKFGRQSLAVKSDELAAAAMGINVSRIKLITFTLGGAISAFAGTLYVHFTTYVEPNGFGWLTSAGWIIMVFVGGINSLTGAIFSGMLLSALPEVLRFADEWRIVIYSVIVLVVVNFRPQGLLGSYEFSITRIIRWFKKHLTHQPAVR